MLRCMRRREQPVGALLAAALALAVLAGLGGCGNAITAEIVGMAAVAVDDDGNPVLLVRSCTDEVDTVEVVGSREGLADDQPNPVLASWTTREPRAGTLALPVARPPAGWTAQDPAGEAVRFAADQQYIVLGVASGADVEVSQVDFRGADLAGLDTEHVLVRQATTWTRARFDAQTCDEMSRG